MNPLEISALEFRKLAARVADEAASYLENLDERPIAPRTSGEETLRLFRRPLPEAGMGEAALDDLREVVRVSRAQNGRFFGYVQSPGEPVAASADLLASVLNQNVTAWRSGPAAVVLEQTVVGWLAEAIGCAGFVGHLAGGGSSANLMGLAMAREARAAANESGVVPGGVVYASSEIHMSIPKSVALLGIGRENLRLIAVDDALRMIPAELEAAMARDQAVGKIPIAVVASAGTVNTGAIDPLRAIAEIARRHGAWFHIDGAYGALAAIADRSKFDGMELADSISLDPHKWLYQPLDCGCLLFRSEETARKTFAHTGDYAKAFHENPTERFVFLEQSMELSRRFRALKLWLSLRYHGMAAFRASIAKDIAQAQRLVEAVRNEPRLELVGAGELSAVCFRYRADGDADQLNLEILARILKRGRIYLSNATLRGKFCLRACIVNQLTTDADVDAVVPEVLAAARDVAS